MIRLNYCAPGEQRTRKAVVIPIRANLPKRSIRQATPDPAEMLAMLSELRSELRYVEEAIATLERLAINRLPERRGRRSKWMSSAEPAGRSRGKGRSVSG